MRPKSSPHRGWHSRGYLPHCDFPGLIQSVSFHLFDSVPAGVIERWIRELQSAQEENIREKLCSQIEIYADMGYGSCYLAAPTIARLVESAILHFDNERYHTLAWCVMPNHAHTLFVQQAGYSMSAIVQSWKSYTSHQANQLLGRQGDFWFPDYFDEFMKSTVQFESTIEYIELNPVTAKLVSDRERWEFSSAAIHHRERIQANRLKFPEVALDQLPDF